MLREHEIQIRVRYSETDAMGFLHHANFFNYFEMGRIEALRASGGDYRAMEEQGLFIVVVEIRCRYKSPARYDDMLTLRTRLARATAARIEHQYTLLRGETVVAEGNSTLACVDRQGSLQRVPEIFHTGD